MVSAEVSASAYSPTRKLKSCSLRRWSFRSSSTTRGLVERAFEMRHAVTVPDACYVALAEQLDCGLLTSDRRLVRAVGDRLPVVVV